MYRSGNIDYEIESVFLDHPVCVKLGADSTNSTLQGITVKIHIVAMFVKADL